MSELDNTIEITLDDGPAAGTTVSVSSIHPLRRIEIWRDPGVAYCYDLTDDDAIAYRYAGEHTKEGAAQLVP